MPRSMREIKIESTRLVLTGVISVGFMMLLAVFLSNPFPGVYCSKIGKLSNMHFGKTKEVASSKNSSAAVASAAISEKNETAREVQNEVMSRSHSTWKGVGEPADDAETEDYGSEDPAPAFKQPPHKLTPNR